jgi:CHAD domain-containing protein
MSYRLDLTQRPETAFQHVAQELLDDAREQLAPRSGADMEKGVHSARKDVKKLRALLRMHRGALGEQTFRRENRALRDAARELSALRDAHVLAETVDGLAERYAGRLPKRAFTAAKRHVAAGAGGDDADPGMALIAARERLTEVAARIGDWTLSAKADKRLRAELARTYTLGLDAFERARKRPEAERLHDWRKRAKDLRHQQELLRPAFPKVISAQAKAASRLGDLLGDDHDLAVLIETLGDDPRHAEVRELAGRRREELQAEVFALGRRVYAEAPKAFARRFGSYLRSARKDARDTVRT